MTLEKRVTLCLFAQPKVAEQRNFFDHTLFGDEETFHRNDQEA